MAALGLHCCELSLLAASRGYSSLQYMDFSLQWLLLFQSMDFRARSSVVLVFGLCCPMACGILPDKRSNLCPLHWQMDFKPWTTREVPHSALNMIHFQFFLGGQVTSGQGMGIDKGDHQSIWRHDSKEKKDMWRRLRSISHQSFPETTLVKSRWWGHCTQKRSNGPLSPPGAVQGHRRCAALPLPGRLHLDVPGRAAPLPHRQEPQGGQLHQRRQIQEEVHVPCRLRGPGGDCGCVSRDQPPRIRHR